MNGKEPKQNLDWFRTSEEEIIEGRPLYRRKKAKIDPGQLSNSAILSLCIMAGLSVGVGSAFATSENYFFGKQAPIDEPPNKAEVNIDIPNAKMGQEPTGKMAPLDEPPSKATIPNNPEVKEKPKQQEKKVFLDQKQEVKESGQEKQSKEEGKQQAKPEQQDTKEKPKQGMKEASDRQETKKTAQPQHVQEKQVDSSKTEQVTTQQTKSVIKGKGQSKHSTVKTYKEKEQKNTDVSPVENVKKKRVYAAPQEPKTVDGAKLPATAGHDLDKAAMGGLTALAGMLYLTKRKEKAEES